MRKILLLICLLVSTNIFAIDKAELDRAKLDSIGYEQMPIGSIIQSILSVNQFQAINGTDWVPLEGQALGSQGSSGKKICDVYAICTLPDARNRYLRTAGTGNENLRVEQAQATAKNGLANSTSSISGSSSGGTWSFGGSTPITNVETSHASAQGIRWGTSTAGTTYGMWSGSTSTDSGFAVRVPSMTVSGSVARTGNSTVSGTAAAQTISGDSETRPQTLVVNTFVKIN